MPDRPSPRATGGETALVVIDVQHSYFEHPALAAQQAELTAAVVELLRTAREAGRPVFLVRTEHARDRSTWTLNMLADGEGFAFPGTRQAALLDGVAAAAPDATDAADVELDDAYEVVRVDGDDDESSDADGTGGVHLGGAGVRRPRGVLALPARER